MKEVNWDASSVVALLGTSGGAGCIKVREQKVVKRGRLSQAMGQSDSSNEYYQRCRYRALRLANVNVEVTRR